MTDLGNAKTFGGIGAILLLIGGFIPFAGPIISIVGLVLSKLSLPFHLQHHLNRRHLSHYDHCLWRIRRILLDNQH